MKMAGIYDIVETVHILTLFSELNHWQIDLLASGLLLSSAVITLIPEELIFILLGFFAYHGRVHPVEAFLAAQIGLVSADLLTVWFGRLLGNNVCNRKFLRFIFSRKGVQQALEKLRTSGSSLVFFARFMPMFRAPVYLAAGISGFSIRRSLVLDLSAASIQITAFFLLGFIFGKDMVQYESLIIYMLPCAIAILVLLSFVPRLLRRTVV